MSADTPPPLVLAAPDWHELDTLARSKEPPILWLVGNQSLVSHWLDHAVRSACQKVILYCPDRPAEVRAALEGGAYWSLHLDLRPTEPAPGEVVERLDHLPGRPALATPPANGGALMQWWLELALDWLRSRDPALVHVDRAGEPGGWIGPRVVLAPGVRLTPPYWIGAGTQVGAGCAIGPNALIGPGCVLSADVVVRTALVQSGTFVGNHLDVTDKLLLGATLLDPAKNARIDLADDFIAAAMRRPPQTTPFTESVLALLLWLPAQILAWFSGPSLPQQIKLPGGDELTLRTGTRGCLLGRRARWLWPVLAGRIRLVGILPRTQVPGQIPAETQALLAHTSPGVFSLADLHGAHDPAQPDELAHALYQAALPAADQTVLRSLLSLCLTRPPHE